MSRPTEQPAEDIGAHGTERSVLSDHPIRTALLELLAEHPGLTANEAARRLGHSSGACSFHLRQLARAGLVEEAPAADSAGPGRRRPWRLRRDDSGPDLGPLLRELEDEGYRRWLAGRENVEPRWRREDAASFVLWLTPTELDEVAAALRTVAGRFADREHDTTRRPRNARPVAVVSRVFPLLNPEG